MFTEKYNDQTNRPSESTIRQIVKIFQQSGSMEDGKRKKNIIVTIVHREILTPNFSNETIQFFK